MSRSGSDPTIISKITDESQCNDLRRAFSAHCLYLTIPGPDSPGDNLGCASRLNPRLTRMGVASLEGVFGPAAPDAPEREYHQRRSTHQMRDSQGIRGAMAKLSCTRTMNAMLA
jgi:hypothetical protein